MFIHYDIVWCNPNSFSCMSYHVNQHGRNPPPPWIWDILRKSQSLSCIPSHYQACRTMQLSLEWPTPPLNMSHYHTFPCSIMHSHHIHAHALLDSLMNSHSFSCMSYNVHPPIMTTTATTLLEYERVSIILSHSHALSWHTCSPIMR